MDDISISDSIYLSYQDLSNLTNERRLVIPWFNESGARNVFPKMEAKPRLSADDGWVWGKSDSSRWDFSGSGKHDELVHNEYEPHLWRVLMSRHVDNFGINTEKGYRRFADPADLLDEAGVIKTDDSVRYAWDHPVLVYRYVARNDDTRTLIASALPESGFLYSTGYIHAIEHRENTTWKKQLALLGFLNSLTADWWTRRIVDRHMTAPVINNIPLPDWSSKEIDEVARLSAELSRREDVQTLPGGVEIEVDTQHEDLDTSEIRAGIESIVLNGFELGSKGISTILNDFNSKACPNSLRSRITELTQEDTEVIHANQTND